jgi:putative flavoprotein involved in K+ transport
MHVPSSTAEHVPVLIIGGGQAGLSVAYRLKQQGIGHLILEKNRIGHAWRNERWDSFCLVTPNWQCQLPDFPYAGSDPHGFMVKDEIVAYLEAFARKVDPNIREDVTVTRLARAQDGGFIAQTTAGPVTADHVVVAISGYHIRTVPPAAAHLPADILQIHSSGYKNARALPEGAVLVVGSGQSGCQIAEDLHLAGRQVHLAVGSAPRSPRFYRGRDAIAWLHDLGHYDMPVHEHPLKEEVRRRPNHYMTGRDGGREIDLRRFAAEGMQLYGRFEAIAAGQVGFRPDLAAKLDAADAVYNGIRATIDRYIAEAGIDAPAEPDYVPPWQPAEERTALDLAAAKVSAVVWATGFRSDFRFIDLPIFDQNGYPTHVRGATAADGLYVIGLPWLYTWGSGRFAGIARDATHIAGQIAAHAAEVAPQAETRVA